MAWYTLVQHVFLYDMYVKYKSATKCQRKFRNERVSRRQTIHNFVNKLITMWLLIDKKQNQNCRVLTEEKLDDIGATLEPTLGTSLKRLAQETGMPKSSTRTATQLLKLQSYKTTVIHALQPHDPANWVHFCCWFLQSVAKVRLIRNWHSFLMKHGFTYKDT
jgi:hypothetical protein